MPTSNPTTREERLVLKAARKYIRSQIPDRVMRPDGIGVRQTGKVWWDYVFVREDGWTFAATDDSYDITLATWSDEWIGGLEFVVPDPPYQSHYRVYIISQGKLKYVAGIIDLDGRFIQDEEHGPERGLPKHAMGSKKTPTPQPRSLEQLREWMKLGCPDE